MDDVSSVVAEPLSAVVLPFWFPDSPIVIGTGVENGEPLLFPYELRTEHVYVLGKTRMGKSTVQAAMALQDIDHGVGCCLLDPHGDIVNDVLARVPGHAAHRVVVLDGLDNPPFSLNLYECGDGDTERAVSRVVEVFKKLWDEKSWGPNIEYVLRNTARTVIPSGGTMLDVPRLFDEKDQRRFFLRRVDNPAVHRFWAHIDKLDRAVSQEWQLIGSTINKLDAFVGDERLRPIIGQRISTVRFDELMDDKTCLLVRLPIARLGEDVVHLVGSTMLQLILEATHRRAHMPADQRKRFHLYVDEYHRFATGSSADLMTDAGKFNVGITVAHQFRGQLDDDNRGATLQMGNAILFRLNGADAEEVVQGLKRPDPELSVVGMKPKLVTPPRPWNHLKQHGFDEPTGRATRLIQQQLSQFEEERAWRKEDQATIRDLYDQYKRTGSPTRSEELFDRLKGLGNWKAVMNYDVDTFLAEIEAKIDTFLVMRIQNPEDTTEAYRFMADELHPAWDFGVRVGFRLYPRFIHQDIDALMKKDTEDDDVVFKEIGNFVAANPPRVHSGEFEPIYGPPPTMADIEKRLAAELSTLPRWTAHCKIGEEEFRMTTIPLTEVELTDFAAAIRLRSFDRFAPRMAVEEEDEVMFADDRPDPPSEDEPPPRWN